MATSEDMSYPEKLRREDERRGRQDGEQRIPSLSEVRRRQQELKDSGGRPALGYQVVLLAELHSLLDALHPQFQGTSRSAAHEIGRIGDRIAAARADVQRLEERLGTASAVLTEDELRPRNPEEEGWRPERLRSRREVERARRARLARESVDAGVRRWDQLRAEHTEAVRRRDEALAAYGVRARKLVELCQRRMATYLDALARSHPDGKTLYALLSVPDIPLPSWIPEIAEPGDPSSDME
ncbi:hypothetical protein Cs7R123_63080 [Catellatospora sp. TT07R-123]|uniref:hypothetical protein n=1 Tax=Catellatospora sp. TT07R-123 TaxID=2733863 RepID=UPI001B059D3E|nr:hypothetical protein [Catellatospora sp. TT07R-123]GHJ48966.1 hypothetical protein Cs7R123_63080 [Catellatospora sp. TT07R-123]